MDAIINKNGDVLMRRGFFFPPIYFVILFFVITFGAHAQAPTSTPPMQLPIMNYFGIGTDKNLGEYLFYEGYASSSIHAATVSVNNPSTGESMTLAHDIDLNNGDVIGVNPSSGWLFLPGNQLRIEAQGYYPIFIQLPYMGTAQWAQLVSNARVYTLSRNGGGNLNLQGPAYEQLVSRLQESARQTQEFQNQMNMLHQMYNNMQQSPSWNSGSNPQVGNGYAAPESKCLVCGGKGTVERRKEAPYYGGDDSGSRWFTVNELCPSCRGRGTR
jgi:hypothetical protein